MKRNPYDASKAGKLTPISISKLRLDVLNLTREVNKLKKQIKQIEKVNKSE